MEGSTAQLRLCPHCCREFTGFDPVCPDCGFDLIVRPRLSLVGTTVGEYQITELIGTGGWSHVYRATHRTLGVDRAVKVLHEHLAIDAAKAQRFQREAQSASALNHPNIVRIYDFGTLPDGQPYIAMDFISGHTLRALLEKDGALNANRAAQLFVQCTRALAEAHNHGIIHRDINPGNIMILNAGSEQEQVKLVDFGLAKLAQGGEGDKLTESGTALGSPAYMSPEQCLGAKVGPASDIYSLGCVFYEVLTGTRPFPANTANEALLKQLSPDPPLPFDKVRRKNHQNHCPAMEAVVFKALEKKSQRRFQDAGQLLDSLLEAQNNTWRARIRSWQRQRLHNLRAVRNCVSDAGARRIVAVLLAGIAVLAVATVVKKFAAPAHTEKDNSAWLTELKRGHELELRADVVHAERVYRAAQSHAALMQAPPSDQAAIGAALAQLYASQGQFPTAIDYFARALILYKQAGPPSDAACKAYETMVQLLMQLKRIDAAASYSDEAYQAMRACYGEHDAHTVNMLANIGALMDQHGQSEKGLALMLQAYDLRMQYAPVHDEPLAVNAINIESVAMHTKHYAQSETFAKRAIELASEVQGKNSLLTLLAIRLYIELLAIEHRDREVAAWKTRAAQIEALHPGQQPFTIGPTTGAENGPTDAKMKRQK